MNYDGALRRRNKTDGLMDVRNKNEKFQKRRRNILKIIDFAKHATFVLNECNNRRALSVESQKKIND